MIDLNNHEILRKLQIELLGEKKVNELIESKKDIPLHTIREWEKILNKTVTPINEGHAVKMWHVNPFKGTLFMKDRIYFLRTEIIVNT